MQDRRGILRIIAVALLLYALASLLTVQRRLTEALSCRDSLVQELIRLDQEGTRLEERIAAYGHAEEMRRLAWERLGMVMPGETVYYFMDGTE